jgi:hypothetical protein
MPPWPPLSLNRRTGEAMIKNPAKDVPTVTADGAPIRRLIEGVVIQSSVTHGLRGRTAG